MTGRSKEETADITLLGNQKTQYPCDYAPEMLETFEVNRILPLLQYHMYPTLKWWKVNH